MTKYLTNQYINILIFSFTIIAFCLARYPQYNVLPFGLVRACLGVVFIHLGAMFAKYNIQHIKLRFIISLLCYGLGLYVLVSCYEVELSSFASATSYKFSYIWFYIACLGGIMAVVSFAQWVGKISFINWIGRNSLVIMCVHFQLIDKMNGLIAETELYNSLAGKCFMAVVENVLVWLSIICCVCLCKRYIPQLTGYR